MIGAGGAAFAGALGILVPGFKDFVLAVLNDWFGTQLYELSPVLGWALLVVGIILLTMAFFGPARLFELFPGRSADPAKTLIVLRHLGFRPPVRTPTPEEATVAGRAPQVIDFPVDLAGRFLAGDLDGALNDHQSRMAELEAVRAAQPSADLAYAGIVQAPFQVLAGYRLSSWTAATLMEWNRVDHIWTSLAPGAGPDLGLARHDTATGSGADIAIALEISFPVATAAVTSSLPTVGRIIRIGLTPPRLDAVTHVGQVNAIAAECRRVLDELAAQGPGGRIHLLIAGPMSVGFRVGQLVSRTLHPLIQVHAYTLNAQPPYSWGLVINPAAGDPFVVRN